MDKQEILKIVDHTLLKQQSTWEEIKQLCDEGIKYSTASVCIPPAFVSKAKEYVNNRLKICTVIGFPNGYSTTDVKIYEANDAIKNGADEIDMVINIGMLKDHLYDEILCEINQIKKVCEDIKLFKKYIKSDKGIKAAGGISSFEDAEKFIKNGATRLGTSRLVKIIEGELL